MLVLLDVEVLEEAMEHSDIGIVDDPVTSFRDALKKAALFYFEKGNAPDAQQLQEAALRQQLSNAVDSLTQKQTEIEELKAQVAKMAKRQDAAAVAARLRGRTE